MIEQSEKENILKAIENNEFNFDTDSLSEDDIENLNEDNIYLGKFTFKTFINEIDIHDIGLNEINKYKNLMKGTKKIKSKDMNYEFIKRKNMQEYNSIPEFDIILENSSVNSNEFETDSDNNTKIINFDNNTDA